MEEQQSGTDSLQNEPKSENAGDANAAERSEAISDGNDRDPQEGHPGDALAWMEGPAFSDPIEEMPTLQWPDAQAEANVGNDKQLVPESTQSPGSSETIDDKATPTDDGLEDAMIWLEELANEQGTPIDDMPTLVSSDGPEQDPSLSASGSQPPPELDSDPIAWLEQLAIDQDSPLEELPSVADRLLASEIASQIEVGADSGSQPEPLASQPVELEDALKYLEDQAQMQGISLDEVTFDQIEPVEPLDEGLNGVDQLAIAAATAAVVNSDTDPPADMEESGGWDDLSAQIPDDPDEALVWLGELAGEESSADEDNDRSALAKGVTAAAAVGLAKTVRDDSDDAEAVSGQPSDDEALDADMLESMPDDPDAAMLWMAGLAMQNENDAVPEANDKLEEPNSEELGLLDDEDFAEARAALSSGDVESAAEQYRELLDGGRGGTALINELETAMAEQPEELAFVHLLGDAYMQDGQLQQALKTYRKGFDHL